MTYKPGKTYLCAGESHNLFLTEEGEVYVVGMNDVSQLGCFGNDDQRLLRKLVFPGRARVSKIFCDGGCANFALTDSKKLFGWGFNSEGAVHANPTEIRQTKTNPIIPRYSLHEQVKTPLLVDVYISKFFKTRIRKVCVSYSTFCILENNDVWVWGNSTKGTLGINSKERIVTPTKLTIPNEVIVDIATCDEHTLFRTRNGNVYSCGGDLNGGLGLLRLPDTHAELNLAVPNKIVYFSSNKLKVIDVAAGRNHSVFVTKCARVFSCGWNNNWQCGFDTHLSHITEPKEIISLRKNGVCRVECGGDHTFFFTKTKYEIFVVGCNASGQSGLNSNENNIKVPTRLRTNLKLIDCKGGQSHSLFLDEDGCVYSCGVSNAGECGFDQAEVRKITKIPKLKLFRKNTFYLTKLFLCDSYKDVRIICKNNEEEL